MAIQTISAKKVKLIRVIDLRPIDWQSGKRLAIPVEECNICDRCGKYHVKVYEVQADGQTYEVGSGCCKRLFGWEPARDEVLHAEKISKDRDIQMALQVVAQPIIDQVSALPVPELRYHSSRWTVCGYDYIFTVPGDDHTGVRVQSNKGILPPQNEIVLPDADRQRFARIWKRRHVRELVEKLGYEEKKAKKLIFAINHLMNINDEYQ